MGAGRAWGAGQVLPGREARGGGPSARDGEGLQDGLRRAGRTWRPGRVVGLSTSSSCVPMAFRGLASDAGLPGAPGSEGCR